METLVHTASGKLERKVQGPVLSEACKYCKYDLTHDPVPCDSGGASHRKPCQCLTCIAVYERR